MANTSRALIESFSGEWLYLHVLSYDEDSGSNFTVQIQEVLLAQAEQTA